MRVEELAGLYVAKEKNNGGFTVLIAADDIEDAIKIATDYFSELFNLKLEDLAFEIDNFWDTSTNFDADYVILRNRR